MKAYTELFVVMLVLGGVYTELKEEGVQVVLNVRKLKDRLYNIIKPPDVSENVSRENLACPIPKTWFETQRGERYCEKDSNCSLTEKCCDWFDKKHCLKGVDTTPVPGQCPKAGMWNDGCLADHVSCQYDAECEGADKKCCLNFGCGYMDCQSLRQNLACPRSPADGPRSNITCSKDVDCNLDEKCCRYGDKDHCQKGVDKIEKHGFCPSPISLEETDCSANHTECEYDSECSEVNSKCCHHPDCSYSVCTDMNRDFTCPKTNAHSYPTNASSTCSADSGPCVGFGLICCATGVNPAAVNLEGVNPAGELVNNCIPGLLHIPKEGQCPSAAVQLAAEEDSKCVENSEDECTFDSQCWSGHKCCNSICGHNRCLQPEDPEVHLLEELIELLDGSTM